MSMLSREVVPLPVTDVDRALAFHTEQAGFTLDVDYHPTAEFRVVQLTPPGSACSVQLVAADSPNRVHKLYLVTTDLAAERAKLIARGVAVGAIRHKDPVETWAGGWSTGLVTGGNDPAQQNERNTIMGLSWQQGPLSGASRGRFLTPEPLPERLPFVEPLRRRLRVKLANEWIADSEDVLLLHEPGRYPVAFFPVADVLRGVLVSENRTTQHRDFGDTEWFTVTVGDRRAMRGAWQYTAVPDYAGELRGRVAFAWRAMDAFYEEDDRIVGHASDAYHRIDIRQSSRHLVVKDSVKLVADTTRPVVLYESGFAPRWYVPREDIDEKALIPAQGQTFCPYKGLASYYDIGDHKRAAWSYVRAWPEVARVSNLVSFEPDEIEVFLDNKKLALEPGQSVVPHGIDRGLDPDEILERGNGPARL